MRLELEPRATTFPLAGVDPIDAFSNSSWDVESLLKKGIAAAQSGDRDLARKVLSQAVAIDPACEDAWMWLASISDYPEELLAFLNRVLEINPNNEKAADWRKQTNSLLAKTFVQKALGARNDGTYTLAAKYLETALAYDDTCDAAWFWKASLAEAEEEKLSCLERALELNPNSEEAAEALLAIHTNQLNSKLDKAEELVASGDCCAAADLVQDLVENDSAEVRERAFMILAKASDADEMKLTYFSRVLEINPYNSTAADALASLEKGRLQTAFEEAKSAAAVGDRAHAIEVLESLVNEYPEFVDGWLLISHLKSSLDDKVAALERALEIDPENAGARSGLAFLALTFGSTGKPDETRMSEPEVDVNDVSAAADLDTTDEPNPRSQAVEVESDVTEQMDLAGSEPIAAVQDDEDPAVGDDPCEASGENLVSSQSAPNEDDQEPITDSPRSVEQLFGPFTEPADPAGETVERLSPFVSKAIEEESMSTGSPASDDAFAVPDFVERTSASSDAGNCPFCTYKNEPAALECVACQATLTLSDLERLLSGTSADREILHNAVTTMEAQWNTREFDEKELTALGLGHLNLGSVESGFRYLQEASRLNPNNVILAGQVNTLAIRLDEMRRQSEVFEAMPKGKNILVVDDSPTVRKLISGKLEKSGHNVVCAVDGVDALAKLEDGAPDLVLLDITMPRMDGYEVCKQIRSNPAFRNLPVVMISGKDGFFDKVRGRMAGTTGYVTKPFGPETLMKALEMYLLPDEAIEN